MLAFLISMRYNNQALLRDGRLAQLVELPLDVRKVTGSSPVPSTIIKNLMKQPFRQVFLFFLFTKNPLCAIIIL